MIEFDWRGWYTAALLVTLLAVLALTTLPADALFLGAITALMIAGVVSPADAFGGLANEGVLTVAVLYIVVAGVRDTGGIQWIVQNVLGRPASLLHAQLRLTLPVTLFSAFLNNTPVVAMLIPAVSEWARRFKLQESKLYIPLSYAAILGGTCTLIGTSTNLVINGLLISHTGEGMGLFDIAWVGIPVALAGLAFMIVTSKWLLPDRKPILQQLENAREYTIEMMVDENGAMADRTIEQAGLRHLPGCYLMEIYRNGDLLAAVSPSERLRGGDRLVFVGMVDSVVDLQKFRGLTPATNQVFKLGGPREHRMLVEAVVSDSCPIVGQTIRDGQFRTRYQAVVIAVSRNGARVGGKVGDIELQPGDTLLLETGQSFLEGQRLSRDFYLTRQIEGAALPRHDRAIYAALILLAMIGLVAFNVLPMLHAALLAAAAMTASRCVSLAAARASIDWSVLIVIACAFGLGTAMEQTGLAAALAHAVVGLAGTDVFATLVALYAATALLTAMMTNNAAAVLMFPIAASMATDLGIGLIPLAVTIMFAASASFATPISYQTNLMVMSPGGYRFADFFRAGLPLTIVTAIVTLVVIRMVWAS